MDRFWIDSSSFFFFFSMLVEFGFGFECVSWPKIKIRPEEIETICYVYREVAICCIFLVYFFLFFFFWMNLFIDCSNVPRS